MLFVIFLKFVERTRERCETSQKETNKENDKDEDRYGTINILFINLYILKTLSRSLYIRLATCEKCHDNILHNPQQCF